MADERKSSQPIIHEQRSKRRSLILEVVSLSFAGCSLIVAIFAYSSSDKSNTIAERALQYSQSSFLNLNRPFVTIRPRKVGKDSTFYEFSVGPNNRVTITLDYELRNIGNVAAVKLRTFDQAVNGEPGDVRGIPMPNPPIVLGPGDVHYVYTDITMIVDNQQGVDSLVSAERTKTGIGFQSQFGVLYNSELDSNSHFVSVTANQYSKNEVISLRYETYRENSNNVKK